MVLNDQIKAFTYSAIIDSIKKKAVRRMSSDIALYKFTWLYITSFTFRLSKKLGWLTSTFAKLIFSGGPISKYGS